MPNMTELSEESRLKWDGTAYLHDIERRQVWKSNRKPRVWRWSVIALVFGILVGYLAYCHA